MANSGGGQIVYGLDRAGGIDGGGISRIVRNNTKAWLEDIIPQMVEPPLKGFAVFPVTDLPGAPTHLDEGKALYVVDVPDSEHAPHQARDLRYYGRLGGKSQPLPHRMILDILNRRKYPLVEPEIECSSGGTGPKGRRTYSLVIKLRNRGPIRARDHLLQVKIPERIRCQAVGIQRARSEEIDGRRYNIFEYPASPGKVLYPRVPDRNASRPCLRGR